MSVEIREMIAAADKAGQESQEVYRWLNSDRSKPLSPELKSRLVSMAADKLGDELAAKTMDEIATQRTPEAMQ